MNPTSYPPRTRRRYRAATEPSPAPSEQPRCDGCAQPPRHPGERADLATTWIVSHGTGSRTAHFCRGCAPSGPVADLTCLRCGDGPLLAGAIAEHPERAEPLLTAAGWRLAGPICPACAPGSVTAPAQRVRGRTR